MTNKTTAEKLAELREKLELAKEPGGEKAVAKRDEEGHPERPRRGSTRCSTRAASSRSARCARRRVIPNALFGDGVVTGHGTINGRPVGVFSHDQTVFQGTVGEMFGRKVARLMEWVAMVGCPIIGINDSGGRPHPGRGRRRWPGTPNSAAATSCCAGWCRRSPSSSANVLAERCIRRSRPTWWSRCATRATCSSPGPTSSRTSPARTSRSTNSAAPTPRPATATSTRSSRTRRRRSSTSATT